MGQLTTTTARSYITEVLRESANTEANPSNTDGFQLFVQEVKKLIAIAAQVPYEMLFNEDNP